MIMVNANNVITVNRVLILRMLIGAVIALTVILIFVLGVDTPNPSWHKTWWVRPIIITPLAGAGGGLFFHFMYELGKNATWKKIVFRFIGIVAYIIALWLGTVLGLAGTLWD
jgi:H+/Cl- antiporter ClcA